MKKIKTFFSLFKLSNLKREAKALGGEVTVKSLATIALLIVVATVIMGTGLMLQWQYCLIALLFFLMCTPFIIILALRSNYEKFRFSSLLQYMEQLIYAFHKNNKINESLSDVYKVSDGHIKETVGKMLVNLNSVTMTKNVYKETFKIMEEEYGCSRLKLLHKYLIDCESRGGENTEALNILLTDIRGWADRTLEYQVERKKARNNVLISIFLAMFTCGMMINLIPKEYSKQIAVMPFYQIATLVACLLSVIVYVIVQTKVSQSYLDIELDGDSSDYAMKQNEFLERYATRNHFKPMIIKTVMMGILIAVELVLRLPNIYVIATATIAMIILSWSGFKKNSAVKTVTKELHMQFPAWIRELSLLLQSDNVHVAIQKSLKDCPKIMKASLENFVKDLSLDPSGVQPYNNFLSQFNVPTLRLSINYLHSAAQFGTKDALSQLDYLIEQNQQLTVAEEKIRNENALAGINLFVFSPMIIAVFKLMVDMVLFIGLFIGMLGSYM